MRKIIDTNHSRSLKNAIIDRGCKRIRSLDVRPTTGAILRPGMREILCAFFKLLVDSTYSNDTGAFEMESYDRQHPGFRALENRMSCNEMIELWNSEYAPRFELKATACRQTVMRWYADIIALNLFEKHHEDKIDREAAKTTTREWKAYWRRIGAYYKWRFMRVHSALLYEVFDLFGICDSDPNLILP